MSDITAHTDIEMVANDSSLSGREKNSSYEQRELMPSLFGEISLMTADRSASTARRSATKGRSRPPSLSDRLTQSLITAGLVKGITPTSIRKRSGAAIPDTVFSWLDGSDAE